MKNFMLSVSAKRVRLFLIIILIMALGTYEGKPQSAIPNPVCYGQPIHLYCTLPGCENPGATITWSNSNGTWTSSDRDPVINPGDLGYASDEFFLSVSYSPPPGGFSGGRVSVVINPQPAPTISGPVSVCENSTGHVYTTQTGMTGYTWTISSGGTITDGDETSAVTVTWSAAGPQTVCVNYTDAYGCSADSPACYSVTVNQNPVVSPDVCFCGNSTGFINLTVAGASPFMFIWSNNVTTPNIYGLTAGTYSVNVTDGNGCSAISVITLAEPYEPPDAPSNLHTLNITATSAELGWTAGSCETHWNIKYGLPGFNPQNEGTEISGVVSMPYPILGLNRCTSYEFFIQSACDSVSVSNWAGPVAFSTNCCPPANENFNDGIHDFVSYNDYNGNVTSPAIIVVESPGSGGYMGDLGMRVTDESGGTWIYDTVNYGGNYLDCYENCLCWDMNVMMNDTSYYPGIYLFKGFDPSQPMSSTNPEFWARFTSYSQTEINHWVNACAKIKPSSLNGEPPVSEEGEWSWISAESMPWNTFIGDIQGIMFRVDVTGWSSQGEIIRYDSICLKPCREECENFDDGIQGFVSYNDWNGNVTSQPIIVIESPGSGGYAGDLGMRVTDVPGGTWIYDTENYGCNYLERDENCLCWDMNVVNNITTYYPDIYLFKGFNPLQPMGTTNPQYWARFTSYSQSEINHWVSTCAKIKPASYTGRPPVSEEGKWKWISNDSIPWNDFISNIQGIMFRVDVTGWSLQGEIIRFDSICLQPCNEIIAEYATVNGIVVPWDTFYCVDAFQGINVWDVTVADGGSATFFSGGNIVFSPLTIVEPGGYLHASITTTGNYCEQGTNLTAALKEEVIPVLRKTDAEIIDSFFKVFPNPTPGRLTLELKEVDQSGPLQIELYGMHGERLMTEKLQGRTKYEFPLAGKPNGVYFIRVVTGKFAGTGKIIKQ